MTISLGFNQYGKAETRVVRVERTDPRHEILDLTVSTSLRGDFRAAHVNGDQSDVLPTDSQKNTVYAYARRLGVATPEEYAIVLAQRFLAAAPAAHSAQVRVTEHAWDRIATEAGYHDHAFVRRDGATRDTVVTVGSPSGDDRIHVVSGLSGLVLLKTTGSQFRDFLRDDYTTLPDADDRLLATSLRAHWRYETVVVDWTAAYDAIHACLLEVFAGTHSRALQETLYLMGARVLEVVPEVAEIRFSAPNRHHVEVDLAPFGLTNEGEVYQPLDRPYGLIEASVRRDPASDAGDAWLAVPAFG